MSCELVAEAWRQPLLPPEKLALLAMCEGEELPRAIAAKCGMSLIDVIDALAYLESAGFVMWAHGRWFFRIGFIYRDQWGRMLQ